MHERACAWPSVISRARPLSIRPFSFSSPFFVLKKCTHSFEVGNIRQRAHLQCKGNSHQGASQRGTDAYMQIINNLPEELRGDMFFSSFFFVRLVLRKEKRSAWLMLWGKVAPSTGWAGSSRFISGAPLRSRPWNCDVLVAPETHRERRTSSKFCLSRSLATLVTSSLSCDVFLFCLALYCSGKWSFK